jgi:hypothetical protein
MKSICSSKSSDSDNDEMEDTSDTEIDSEDEEEDADFDSTGYSKLAKKRKMKSLNRVRSKIKITKKEEKLQKVKKGALMPFSDDIVPFRWKGFKPAIEPPQTRDGKTHVSTNMDLNVHFDKTIAHLRRNNDHWPLAAGIREIMANGEVFIQHHTTVLCVFIFFPFVLAIDAVFASI